MNKETTIDNINRWIARKLPKRIVYFATIELLAKTTNGKYRNTLACELTVDEAIRRKHVIS
jgi:hypothetical protein